MGGVCQDVPSLPNYPGGINRGEGRQAAANNFGGFKDHLFHPCSGMDRCSSIPDKDGKGEHTLDGGFVEEGRGRPTYPEFF